MTDLSEFVTLANDGSLVTDTRRIAKHFKKAHKNVLRAFDQLDCSAEFSRLNFEPRDFIDERGKPQRTIQMTKDGFMYMVLGFHGAKAGHIKEIFIGAFNRMAAQLAALGNGLWQQRLALECRDASSSALA